MVPISHALWLTTIFLIKGAAVAFYNPVNQTSSAVYSVAEQDVDSTVEVCLQLILESRETERAVNVLLSTQDDSMGMDYVATPIQHVYSCDLCLC